MLCRPIRISVQYSTLAEYRYRLLHTLGQADLEQGIGDPALFLDHQVAADDAA